ncbi:MAG: hypothetical protein ACREBW_01950 [Candidatus Micrarchaeaceae archaeon]
MITIIYCIACTVSFLAGLWLGYHFGWEFGNYAGYKHWHNEISKRLKEKV